MKKSLVSMSILAGLLSWWPASHQSVRVQSTKECSDPISIWLRRFCSPWQIVGMARKKINFGRTSIAPAKAAVKRYRAAKKKKAAHNQKDSPKQVELEPKFNVFLEAPNSQVRWLRSTSRRKRTILESSNGLAFLLLWSRSAHFAAGNSRSR